MKFPTRLALAAFVSAIIIYEPQSFTGILSSAIDVFGKEAAKIEARKVARASKNSERTSKTD